MKLLITTAIALLVTVNSFAQQYISQAKPLDKKEWGYINEKGEFIIEAKYRKCYKFSSDGLAPIYEAKKYIFITPSGETLPIETKEFKLLSSFGFGLQGFNDGMIQIVVDKKWGYLNSEGKLAVELKYDKANSFDGGFATVKLGTDFFVINKTGTEIKIADATVFHVKGFVEGLAPFNTADKKNGFINTKGEVVIPAKFLAVGYFVNGLAWARDLDKKIGYINTKGEWIIEPKFQSTKDFDKTSGLARVKINDKWAYTNKAGEITNVDDTEAWGDFNEGLAKGKKGGKTGYYDSKGAWVIEPKYEGGRDFKNGFAAIKLNGKWGFINNKGEIVVEPQFSGIKDLELVK